MPSHSHLLQVEQDAIKKSSADDSFHCYVLKSLWSGVILKPNESFKTTNDWQLYFKTNTDFSRKCRNDSWNYIHTKWPHLCCRLYCWLRQYWLLFPVCGPTYRPTLQSSFHVLLDDTCPSKYCSHASRNESRKRLLFATDTDHVPTANSYDFSPNYYSIRTTWICNRDSDFWSPTMAMRLPIDYSIQAI